MLYFDKSTWTPETLSITLFFLSGFVRFIDFEYADFNYQAYDIGNHFNEFAGGFDALIFDKGDCTHPLLQCWSLPHDHKATYLDPVAGKVII